MSKDKEQLEKKILFKRVIEWSEDFIKLEDGKIITLETSEFPPIDAMITDIVIGDMIDVPHEDTIINSVEQKIFRNQYIICQAEMEADAGNGGYYYSVGSLVMG